MHQSSRQCCRLGWLAAGISASTQGGARRRVRLHQRHHGAARVLATTQPKGHDPIEERYLSVA